MSSSSTTTWGDGRGLEAIQLFRQKLGARAKIALCTSTVGLTDRHVQQQGGDALIGKPLSNATETTAAGLRQMLGGSLR